MLKLTKSKWTLNQKDLSAGRPNWPVMASNIQEIDDFVVIIWPYGHILALGSYFGFAVKIAHTVIIDPVANFDVVFKFDLSIRSLGQI